MSRLEKARDEKQKGKKKTKLTVIVVLGIVIIAGLVVFAGSDRVSGILGQEEADFIDMEKSDVFIDIFDLTYVRIYVKEGEDVEKVSADGNQLEYNAEDERWEITMSNYGPGDEIKITAEESGVDGVQEVVLVVEEL